MERNPITKNMFCRNITILQKLDGETVVKITVHKQNSEMIEEISLDNEGVFNCTNASLENIRMAESIKEDFTIKSDKSQIK